MRQPRYRIIKSTFADEVRIDYTYYFLVKFILFKEFVELPQRYSGYMMLINITSIFFIYTSKDR